MDKKTQIARVQIQVINSLMSAAAMTRLLVFSYSYLVNYLMEK